MNDMSAVIVPKSDQINADTLLAGPMTVTIRDVQIRGGQEQPVSISLEETELAYRPCKSMSRVLVQAWGADAKDYIGRSLTLYRDPSVKWGGLEVGGIRISHMTDIDGKKVMQLTATKGQRKPHVVMPLKIEREPAPRQQTKQTAQEWADEHLDVIDTTTTAEELDALETKCAKIVAKLADANPDLHTEVLHAYQMRREAMSVEGPAAEQSGDGFADDVE